MANVGRILSHMLVVLSITSLADASVPDCQVTKANTLSGNFKHLAKLNCSWTYIAPTGMKLLFKIDNVRFLPRSNSSLKIFTDDKVIIISKSCVKCFQQMISGHVVKLVYQSDNSSAEIPDEVSAFQIRYKAYDPDACDKPMTPANGFVTVIGQKLGQDIYYSCSPPYEMVGASRAQCIVPDDSPAPQWSNEPPDCIVPNCTEEAIEKTTRSGAIASPGYPTYKLYTSMRCVWVITVDIGYQIKASFAVVHLTGPRNDSVGSLLLYDGDENRPFLVFNETIWIPQNFSTKTNKLLVRLNTFNKEMAEGGFLMVYSTVRGSCPEPSPPHFGEVVAYSLAVRSVVSYRCMPGYALVGQAQSECLSGGVWSSKKPWCQLVTTTPSIRRTVSLQPVHNSKLVTPTVSVAGSTVPSAHLNLYTEQMVPLSSPFSEDVRLNLTSFSPAATRTESGTEPVPNTSIPVPKAQNKNGPLPLSNTAFENDIEGKRKASKETEEEVSGVASHYSPNENSHIASDDEHLTKSRNEADPQSNSTTFIIVGVSSCVFLLFLFVIIVALIYKKRHPMGMRFRRKFSTFENPMYVRKEPCHPRELKRLTV